MTYEKSWTDWWRKFLGVSPNGYRDVIKILSSRYVEEMQHVQRYTAHAEQMQYPQFREKLLRIANNDNFTNINAIKLRRSKSKGVALNLL